MPDLERLVDEFANALYDWQVVRQSPRYANDDRQPTADAAVAARAALLAEFARMRAGQTWIAGPPMEPGWHAIVTGDGCRTVTYVVYVENPAAWSAPGRVLWHRPVVHPPISDQSEPCPT